MMRRAQPWLGTLVEVAVSDETACEPAMRAAFEAVAEVHRLTSFHDEASDLARINRAGIGEEVAVHPRTAEVLAVALALVVESEGLFNPFCAPRLVAWGQLPAPVSAGPVPDWRARSDALALDGTRLRKNAPAWIDLGGIAKGYAVDAAVDALRSRGMRGGCVNAGGDLRAFGDIDWPVLLRDARRPEVAAWSTQLRDGALATSATYFSRKNRQGKETSALVHGTRGMPLLTEASISVAAPTCILADALTKVVAASNDEHHPLLASHGATAFVVTP